jgi:organic hydroperoxide reductase OsmC/OhrA
MLGTFGGALEARRIAASEGNLAAEVTGEVEVEGKVLVVKRIHVRLRLRAPEASRATAERVHGIYADACPIYRSIKAAIAVTSELAFEAA